MLNPQVPVREQRPGRMLQDKAQGPDVRAPPIGVVIADERDLVRIENIETEFLEFVVHQRGKDRVTLSGLGVFHLGTNFLRQGQQGGAVLHSVKSAVVL